MDNDDRQLGHILSRREVLALLGTAGDDSGVGLTRSGDGDDRRGGERHRGGDNRRDDGERRGGARVRGATGGDGGAVLRE